MEATEIRLFPGHLLVKHATVLVGKAVAKSHVTAMQSLGRIAAPGFDGVEVIQLRHAPARGRKVAACRAAVCGELRGMKDVSQKHPILVKVTREDFLPKAGESIGFVDFVPVHAEYPG